MLSNPTIEVESIRAALEAMRQATPLGLSHPLAQFVSIRYPRMVVGGSAANDAIIFRYLAHAIRYRLNRQRALCGLPTASQLDSAETIQDDFRQNNSELEAWSILYYRYVRVDLDLPIDRLQALTGQPARTLNRRQSRGIARLTHDLARRETLARIQQRKVDLRARLPTVYCPALVGRETLIEAALHRLVGNVPPRHLLIYGAPGVGKTVLALAVAHTLIDREPIQSVAWVDHPDSDPARLREQITLQLGIPADGRTALAGYLQIADTLIVLDHAQVLFERPETMPPLLGILGAARLLISVTQGPPDPTVPRLYVDALDKEAALELMTREADKLQKTRDIDHWNSLYEELGGNPRALRQAISAGRHYRIEQISADLYRNLWDEAAPLTRLVWMVLAQRPAASLREETLRDIFAEHDADEIGRVLDRLVDLSIAEWQQSRALEPPDNIALTPLAWSFIEQTLHSGDERMLALHAVRLGIDYLTTHPTEVGCLSFLASIDHTDLPVAQRLDCAYVLAPIIERCGAWSAWASHLESIRDAVTGKDHLWVGLHLGIARRWLAQWTEAAYLLADVLAQAGQAGDFAMQAEAMVELASVYRQQGRHDMAGQLLSRAHRFYQRQGIAAGLDRISADRVQLLLEAGDIGAAQRLLRDMEKHDRPLSPQVLSLAAIVGLRTGDLDSALELAELARSQMDGDKPHLARVLALLGQIHYQRGDSTSAINDLTSALALMEQNHDLLGFARARMNLAAVYLGHGNLRTALRYLRDLPTDLENLGDKASLEVVRKNLEILNRAAQHWVRAGEQRDGA